VIAIVIAQGGFMAQLIVRNLEDDVRDKLRVRAQLHGRSMEEEVRDILRAAVVEGVSLETGGLGTKMSNRFADCHLDQDAEISEWRGVKPRPADF
jgi:antitoxin FitA